MEKPKPSNFSSQVRHKQYLFTIGMMMVSLLLSCRDIKKEFEIKPLLRSIKDIRFTEVRRAYQSGLSFNDFGYQLEPELCIAFTSDTTVEMYHPKMKKFVQCPVYYSHGDIFNFGRKYFRVKTISKDSLVFQLLKVNGRFVSEKVSNVYMTFYSSPYLNNILHKKPHELRVPNSKDSLFVMSKAAQANCETASIFCARNPVVLKSKRSMLQVEKVTYSLDPHDILSDKHPADDYLNPGYKIRIDNAYKDFAYSFQARIDTSGRIHFLRFLTPIKEITPEFLEPKTRVVNGIIDVYLQSLLDIKPGSTLGFAHASIVKLNVVGIKN